MKWVTRWHMLQVVLLGVLLLCAVALPGQTYRLRVPLANESTLTVGAGMTFHVVGWSGRATHNVFWTISDPGAFLSFKSGSGSNDLTVIAKQAGDFQVIGRSPTGLTTISVKVMPGRPVPTDKSKWAAVALPGCKITNVIPGTQQAQPGFAVDAYVESQCENGRYVSAYNAAVHLMWRSSVNNSGEMEAENRTDDGPTAHLDPHSASVCDSVAIGTSQQKIREMLKDGKLSFNEGPSSEHAWTVDEPSVQCKMWFDEKLVLTKKRKVFVSE